MGSQSIDKRAPSQYCKSVMASQLSAGTSVILTAIGHVGPAKEGDGMRERFVRRASSYVDAL